MGMGMRPRSGPGAGAGAGAGAEQPGLELNTDTSDDVWRRVLDAETYSVLRKSNTEAGPQPIICAQLERCTRTHLLLPPP
jgi:hypothetical protein